MPLDIIFDAFVVNFNSCRARFARRRHTYDFVVLSSEPPGQLLKAISKWLWIENWVASLHIDCATCKRHDIDFSLFKGDVAAPLGLEIRCGLRTEEGKEGQEDEESDLALHYK